MLHQFLSNNRDDLIERCRLKVAHRPARGATARQLRSGMPLFLDQLIQALRLEQTARPMDSRKISGPAGGRSSFSAIGTSASLHGRQLLELGFSVSQVVHDYGDLCQAITDLAIERDAPFQVEEFQTLNRCLDNAIADAVTEFSYQRDSISAEKLLKDNNERLSYFVHEMHNLLGTTALAFTAAKVGNLSLSGATGTILERSIFNLSNLIDDSLVDIKEMGQQTYPFSTFDLSTFIADAKASVELLAEKMGYQLEVLPVDADLRISGNRSLLLAALAHIL